MQKLFTRENFCGIASHFMGLFDNCVNVYSLR